MQWDAFTLLEQALILLTIGSQVWISLRVIRSTTGAEQYVRLMSFCAGLLLFLLGRPLRLTFADLLLAARVQDDRLHMLLIGGAMPFLVGVFVSEATLVAMRLGHPVWVRTMLMVAAFTASQAAYTNFIALSTQATRLDHAFIPNLCYAIAVGVWLTFRYREVPQARAE